MTVEERRGPVLRDAPQRDQFPVGLRVLAVDDDPTCLTLLENLLRHCQYHVTTTNQAITALKLLRENKDKFDLIISDVHMPDMDGFKLLELVGLEVDLPFIMLSSNSDTKVVMKGITHGACDYLLKPVRIEELKNIWQHVVRRKKFDSKDHSNSEHGDDCEKPHYTHSDSGQSPIMSGPSDNNGKLNRKRKDQSEEDDDDCVENGYESENPSTHKKPRVVWTVDLHRKFVAAVNELGPDKAVPKRILDLMNVEGLTRENVASHLQKYRLYLKRISAVASQQANIVSALGGKDSYLSMGPLAGVGNFPALAGSRQLPSLTSFQPGGVLGRLNSPTGSGFERMGTNGMIQLGHNHNKTSNSIHDLVKLPWINLSGVRQGNLLQGMPTSLGLDQLQQHKPMHETNSHLRGSFYNNRLPTGSSSNSFLSVTSNPLMLQAHQQKTESGGPFKINFGASSHLTDLSRCNDTWQGAVPLTGYSANNVPQSVSFGDENVSLSYNLRDHISPLASMGDVSSHDVSPSSTVGAPVLDPLTGDLACTVGAPVLYPLTGDLGCTVGAPLLDPLTGDLDCQANSLGGNTLFMPTVTNATSRFSSFGNVGNSKQRWDEQEQDLTCKSNNIFNSTLDSTLPIPASQSMGQDGFSNKTIDISMINQSNFSSAFVTQHCGMEKSTTDGQLKFKDDYLLEPSELQSSNDYHSFDDLMNAMIKQDLEDVTLMDGDIGCDIYPLESCM